MTPDDKLAAILAAVQTDPGNRGLARDTHDNLFTATKGDFEAACRSIAEHPAPGIAVSTGFYIPTANPPAHETDGPLGAVFLHRGLEPLGVQIHLAGPAAPLARLLRRVAGVQTDSLGFELRTREKRYTHELWLEVAGPAADGKCYSMRGRDITAHGHDWFRERMWEQKVNGSRHEVWIGIGDGGNEIGMGKIPHETVVKNIPNGDLIHCRVPTDHLIVAGVSNWGAYALAAGVFVLKGITPPADLFDPDREREILEVMVREGPLVDGVTGQQTATVDGLTWDEYVKPLIRIREILES